jgi:restriction system protein
MRRAPKQHLLHQLAALPWPVSVAFALFAFSAVRWLLPAVAGSNRVLGGLVAALHGIAWVFAVPFLVVAVVAAVRSAHRRSLLSGSLGLDELKSMSWQNFERLVGEAYRRQGYVVEEAGGSAPDGGIDLLLFRRGGKTIVQCKRWKTSQVGVSLIREFYGVMVSEKAERGVFVTTGRYTADALAFAHGKPMELIDGPTLVKMLQGLPAP